MRNHIQKHSFQYFYDQKIEKKIIVAWTGKLVFNV